MSAINHSIVQGCVWSVIESMLYIITILYILYCYSNCLSPSILVCQKATNDQKQRTNRELNPGSRNPGIPDSFSIPKFRDCASYIPRFSGLNVL